MSDLRHTADVHITEMGNAARTNRYLTDEAKAAYAIALRDRDLGIQSDDEQLATKIKVHLLANKLKGKACELAQLMASMGIRFGISSNQYGGTISFDCCDEKLNLCFNSDGNLMDQFFTNWKHLTANGTI